ncbi:Arylamine N-acetyltransferase, pineal gland isozyme NAT-3 [Stylophora pistillata]|uniref:arylamine N-acetyltransferase n=1 Tax=Stylophora pistillata TaxID=50429 RepID=A0A2B4RSB5_STYPI|nr:Arylamine N-acetyltransferase, pineal gland isozyme NAT-3 [Stylophora pistillata]
MAQELERFAANEVDEYLARIRYTGPIEPTLEVLEELQRCHILSVPFENLSVYGKEEIVLSKEWLFDKVVRRHRGGFCYELNTVFSLLLDYIGFEFQRHASEVYSRKTGRIGPPFDHMILVVNIEGALWLTDVGFGDSFLTPLLFGCSADQQEQSSGTYRIRKEGDRCFYEEKVKTIVDEFDPKSPFTHDRICTMAKPWGRITFSGNKVTKSTYLGDNKIRKETKELLGGEEEIVKELEQQFGIKKESCLYPEGSMYCGSDQSKERKI